MDTAATPEEQVLMTQTFNGCYGTYYDLVYFKVVISENRNDAENYNRLLYAYLVNNTLLGSCEYNLIFQLLEEIQPIRKADFIRLNKSEHVIPMVSHFKKLKRETGNEAD